MRDASFVAHDRDLDRGLLLLEQRHDVLVGLMAVDLPGWI